MKYTPVLIFGAAACVASIGFLRTRDASNDDGPQCGHWCTFRCCQLLGVPVDLRKIVRMMPPDASGHTLQQLADSLGAFGLKTTGRKATESTLRDLAAPFIAHLNPDHFVVVLLIQDDGVHIFDGNGRRSIRDIKEFVAQWTGNVLTVRRPGPRELLPTNIPRAPGTSPCIQFDELLVDRGEFVANGQPVTFAFRFRNLGKDGLAIKDVRSSCKCMEAKRPENQFGYGEGGVITVTYRPPNTPGPFFHETTVETNDPVFPTVKLVAGGSADVAVRVSPPRLNLGELLVGTVQSTCLLVTYTGDQETFVVNNVTSSLRESSLKTFLTDEPTLAGKEWWPFQQVLRDRVPKVTVVEVVVHAKESAIGPIDGQIVIETSAPKFKKVIVPVKGKVSNVAVVPSLLALGEVQSEHEVRGSLKVKTRLKEPLKLVGFSPHPKDMTCELLPANTKGEAEVRVTTTGASALALSGSTLNLEMESGGNGSRFVVSVPVYAWNARRPQANAP